MWIQKYDPKSKICKHFQSRSAVSMFSFFKIIIADCSILKQIGIFGTFQRIALAFVFSQLNPASTAESIIFSSAETQTPENNSSELPQEIWDRRFQIGSYLPNLPACPLLPKLSLYGTMPFPSWGCIELRSKLPIILNSDWGVFSLFLLLQKRKNKNNYKQLWDTSYVLALLLPY